ncbi:hypothetical protein HDU91_000626, partial [Kappamyces sp. JEL0680]
MAFNIMSRIGNERLVFYFLYAAVKESFQEIYLNFKNISKLFRNCVNYDASTYSDDTSPSCSSLFGEELFVYGFIYELLANRISNRNVKIVRKTGQQVLALMNGLNFNDTRPIFIIDECIAVSRESLLQIRFVRNCFRSLGLGLILLGTDSKAAQLPVTIGDTSRRAKPTPWCHIFGQFPKVKIDLLDLPSERPDHYIDILKNSRPLFSHLAASNLANLNLLDPDAIFRAIFNELADVKPIFDGNNFYGKLGQLRIFQNSHLGIADAEMQSAALIHSHFAQLTGPKNFTLMNSGRTATNPDSTWTPTSVFPNVIDDVLLYLTLMGGKDFPAFRKDGKRVPYAYFFMETMSMTEHRSQILEVANAVQKSNDGMFLESLMSSTVCLASHSNGIQGVQLDRFLVDLVYQLQQHESAPSDVEIGGLEKLGKMRNFVVPFLSPPNQDWPDYVYQLPGSAFGYLERTKNKDRIDLRVAEHAISGESKDTLVDSQAMKKILTRIPANTKLEF